MSYAEKKYNQQFEAKQEKEEAHANLSPCLEIFFDFCDILAFSGVLLVKWLQFTKMREKYLWSL